ncbi:peptidase domain-containing ABC transporter [uncultured Herbaspirillum sp.]|uniref:peptidase domain-containing ABC transporter n=1 Tax=uncultured Herbaspirillum sp. TaxID=160236 RepID=UPI0026391F00|nr:peptidase domain-containing ABC transporter [uncultured Herbaspirillum sp.]
MNHTRFVAQDQRSECGLACLAMIASYHGHQIDLSELRRRFATSANGSTLRQLIGYAARLHLSSRALRIDLDAICHLRTPCILHWQLNHFVVMTKARKNARGRVSVTILDPAVGERTLDLKSMSACFTGVALELLPTSEFTPLDERKKISPRQLSGPIIGLRRALLQLITLALALEMLAICTPLFNQFIIDEVISSGDRELLTVLTLGFGLAIIVQTAISLARSWLLMRWQVDISLQWGTRVFAHLCRLPFLYFQKRTLGDIASRFGSISTIQGSLSGLFAENLLDGAMAVIALGMMLLYSPKLTLVVVIAMFGYTLLRVFLYQPLREASRERLVLSAKENSFFLETVRAHLPVKLFGQEAHRCARWQNLKQDVLNRETATQKLTILFRLTSTAIFSTQGLVLFYLGAEMVMENILTVGMLMAFISYATTFSQRILTLTDLAININMLDVHTQRLADIVMEPAEPRPDQQASTHELKGTLTVRNLRFRYGEDAPWLIDGIDLTITAGQSLAITGPSGSGKTTLCKILLGLLRPTEGEILLDGVPIHHIGLQRYREMIGTVMQDDILLTGSLLENISFFASPSDEERVKYCANLAAIDRDIAAMPMGYQTMVGELDNIVSGGQKQRILLARALYKQPRILLLDEASSQLDLENERKINEELADIQLTRIVIAHRPETIASCDRIVMLHQGKIEPIS